LLIQIFYQPIFLSYNNTFLLKLQFQKANKAISGVGMTRKIFYGWFVGFLEEICIANFINTFNRKLTEDEVAAFSN
jgi:hypothetical protein